MEATKLKRLMTVLHKHNVNEEQRHELIYAWTLKRTNSATELTDKEADDLIWKMENDAFFTNNVNQTANAIIEIEMKRKRAVVLAIAQRTGIHTGTTFEKFNSFMLNSSILKKKLAKYSFEELDQLIQQFKKLEANFEESAKKAGTKAWHKKYGIPEIKVN